jgi:hypothetical protein
VSPFPIHCSNIRRRGKKLSKHGRPVAANNIPASFLAEVEAQQTTLTQSIEGRRSNGVVESNERIPVIGSGICFPPYLPAPPTDLTVLRGCCQRSFDRLAGFARNFGSLNVAGRECSALMHGSFPFSDGWSAELDNFRGHGSSLLALDAFERGHNVGDHVAQQIHFVFFGLFGRATQEGSRAL